MTRPVTGAGAELVGIVESAFSAVRAERDEAVHALAEVVHHLDTASLPPDLAVRVRRITGT